MDLTLDQSDIDALLNAAAEAQSGEDEEGPQIFTRYRRELDDVEITEYDFKRPERISKDQMLALQTLHEAFARNIGAALSGFLRTIVEVRVAHAEQMTYAEFISSLPNPTSFNLIEAPDLGGQMCLELSPLIIYPIIDRLLGGSNQDLFIPQRSMTMIETRLIRTILDRSAEALREAWDSVKSGMTFNLGDMESNPHIVQIVPPNEVVVVIGFEVKLVNRAGTMTLCIPFQLIEPLMEDLSSHSWFVSGDSGTSERFQKGLRQRLGHARVEIATVLAETSILMSELETLEVGDLIVTEKPATEPVRVLVGEHPKFHALIGTHRGNRAVRIVRPVRDGERLD